MTALQRPGTRRPGSSRSVLVALAIFVAVGGLAVCSPAEARAVSARLETAAASPGRPGRPVAVAGDGRATVTVVAPTSGGPFTGYVVRVFEDNNDRCIITSATQTSCVVEGLINGIAYTFESIATGTGDSSPWSVPSAAVTPRATGSGTPTPTPSGSAALTAPTGVTAVAGISSVPVTWSAVTGATGYTATADPGGAGCEVIGTSCVLGVKAGEAVTVRVVAHAGVGDSAPSAASAAIVVPFPSVPATLPASALPGLSTEDGTIGLTTQGRPIVLTGSGFLPHSSVRAALHSAPATHGTAAVDTPAALGIPVTLGTTVTDAGGAFAVRVEIPGALPSGAHTLLAVGADPDGNARMITMPITVAGTETGSHGKDGAVQTVTLPIPTGGAVTLLTDTEAPTSTITVAGGVYTLTPATGVVRFVPAAWFTGIAPPARYRVSDAAGSVVTGTYTAVVTATADASKPVLKLPRRIVSSVGDPATAPVSCAIARGVIARCVVTASATVAGEKVVVGYGLTTPALTRNQQAVTVATVLNELGRYLAARPGGATVTFAAQLIQRDQGGSQSTSASTVVEAKRYRLGRAVAFGSNSGTVSSTGKAYLKKANAQLQDGVKLTCTGHADRREHTPKKLAVRRAKAACAVLGQGLGADVTTSGQVEKPPTGDDDTAAGRARNRRVTVTVTN